MRYIVTYLKDGDTIRELSPWDTREEAEARAYFVKGLRGVDWHSVRVEEIAEPQASAVPPE